MRVTHQLSGDDLTSAVEDKDRCREHVNRGTRSSLQVKNCFSGEGMFTLGEKGCGKELLLRQGSEQRPCSGRSRTHLRTEISQDLGWASPSPGSPSCAPWEYLGYLPGAAMVHS